jgi:hypothetical protein
MFLDTGEAEAIAPRRAAAVKSLFCIVMIVEEVVLGEGVDESGELV